MNDEIYVLDACALIAFFNDEPGAEKMETLLERAALHEVTIVMSVVNLFTTMRSTITQKLSSSDARTGYRWEFGRPGVSNLNAQCGL